MISEGERRNYTAYKQLIFDALGKRIVPILDTNNFVYLAEIVDQAMEEMRNSSRGAKAEEALALRYPLILTNDFEGAEKAENTFKEVAEVLPHHSRVLESWYFVYKPDGYGVSRPRAEQLVGDGRRFLARKLLTRPVFKRTPENRSLL